MQRIMYTWSTFKYKHRTRTPTIYATEHALNTKHTHTVKHSRAPSIPIIHTHTISTLLLIYGFGILNTHIYTQPPTVARLKNLAFETKVLSISRWFVAGNCISFMIKSYLNILILNHKKLEHSIFYNHKRVMMGPIGYECMCVCVSKPNLSIVFPMNSNPDWISYSFSPQSPCVDIYIFEMCFLLCATISNLTSFHYFLTYAVDYPPHTTAIDTQ